MGRWALGVCVACILAGVLELILPPRQGFKSIKTVLALYILLAVVSPAQQTDWSGLLRTLENSKAVPNDYSGYVDAYSQTALAEGLQARLAAAGLLAQVKIENTDPLQIVVRAHEAHRAEELIRAELPQMENLQIITEELQNDG